MDGRLNRRQALRTAIGGIVAAATLPYSAEADSAELLRNDKNKGVEIYMQGLEAEGNEPALAEVSKHTFWGLKGSGSFSSTELRRQLYNESLMELASESDVTEMKKKYGSVFIDDCKDMKEGGRAVFIDGDAQTTYVARKNNGEVRFLKKYPSITSKNGWGSADGKTPVGKDTLKEFRIGLFGEVISTLKEPVLKHPKHFQKILVDGGTRKATYVFGLTKDVQKTPEVISAAILIDGERGIWLHAAPRKGFEKLPPDERRKVGSNGCIGASAIDVIDIMHEVRPGDPVYILAGGTGGTTQSVERQPIASSTNTKKPGGDDGWNARFHKVN